jgi:hypothetical protein
MPWTKGGNASARRHARAPTRRRRTAAVRRRTTALPRSRARLALAPHAPTGRLSSNEPACHAACARSPRRHQSGRRARTPRVVVPRALTRRSRHCEALRPACVLGYKRPPSSSPAREPAARRSAIAPAAGELTAPLAPAAGQTLVVLH